MALTGKDISAFEVAMQKTKRELALVKAEKQKLLTELTDKRIQRTEMECSLKVKTELRRKLQRNISMKQNSHANLENRDTQAKIQNTTLKHQLTLITSQNDELKKMLHAVESEKNEYSLANTSLKKKIDDYQKFKKNLCATKDTTEETISKLKSQLKIVKEKNKIVLKTPCKIPDTKLKQEIDKLKDLIMKEMEERHFLIRESCHYKELNKQLMKYIEEDTTHKEMVFYHEMLQTSLKQSRSVVDAQTEYNKLYEELKNATQ